MHVIAHQRMYAAVLPIVLRRQRLDRQFVAEMMQHNLAHAHFALKCIKEHVPELGLADGQNDVLEHHFLRRPPFEAALIYLELF
jgi:hypothetical protein